MSRAACVLLLVAACPAQELQVWSMSSSPSLQGFTVVGSFTNTTTTSLSLWNPLGTCSLAVLTPDGDPTGVSCAGLSTTPPSYAVPPGGSVIVTFYLPAQGPRRWTVVLTARDPLLQPHRFVAAVQGLSSPAPLPSLAFWPAGLSVPPPWMAVNFFDPGTTPWSISNTGAAAHTFGAGDRLDVLAPGGSVALASLPLDGITIPAGRVVDVVLPVGSLPPGPYTVRATWFDPAVGSLRSPTHGIRSAVPPGAELYAVDGHEVPSSGTLRMVVPVSSFAFSGPVDYLFLLSSTPGALTLPGGAILPLAPDPLFDLTLAGGLGGFFFPRAGTVTPAPYEHVEVVVAHPGPALSGLGFRVAAVMFDQGAGVLQATQSEELSLQ